jgi:hypothetical protein
MLLQVIEFLSLFSLYLAGVMIVPRGTTDDSDWTKGAKGRFTYRLRWTESQRLNQYVALFLLVAARAVLKWYFQLYFKTFTSMLEQLQMGLDLYLCYFGPFGSLSA